MIHRLLSIFGTAVLSVASLSADTTQWDLNRCLSYAREKNISVRTLHLDKQSDAAALEKARAARVPDLWAGTSYSLSKNNAGDFSGSASTSSVSQRAQFSLSSGVTLFNGFKTRNDIAQKELQIDMDNAAIEENTQLIEVAVTQAYLQVLFAHESHKNAENNRETTVKQFEYTQERYNVGSASVVELEQMRSQVARDEYEVIIARNEIAQRILELKQLLELTPVETFTPYFPVLRDSIQLPELPDKEVLFQKALENLPQVKKSKLAVEIAETEKRKSTSGYYPTINLSGSISSHYTVDASDGFSTQMEDNFSPSAGVQLSVPITDNKQTKTAVTQSDIAMQKAILHYEQLEKTVLMEVEKTYENCVAVYNRYRAAIAQLKAAHTSYDLAQQQHALGMLKPTELLVQRDLYNDALQELTRAKYSALLSYQLLTIYEGKHISFPEEFSLKE